ncbi:MAG: molybdenum cofactor biosynthesis protein B [Lysobacteraceae bacterium]|nr:MAG: molybdenum cofactor biosynthesis protein B [Xanthomonadaceae bacterium]
MSSHGSDTFVPLSIAVLTVSDSRTMQNDTSGTYLQQALEAEGHHTAARKLVADNKYLLRAVVSAWIADPEIDAIICTGGTGFTNSDCTPEALLPLLDKEMPGFGEMFRQLSWDEIGTSTMQSRAFGGIANATFVFCLPGSTGACTTAWEQLLSAQLDARTRPCNLTTLRPRL